MQGGPRFYGERMTGPGWYPDQQPGMVRYYDGQQWTQHVQPAPPPTPYAVAYPPQVRQSMDRSQYVRTQTGHSLILHIIFGGFLLWIPSIYYAVSPNHYFHV